MSSHTPTFYADRRSGVLLVPQRYAHHLDTIAEDTDFPEIVVSGDDIDTPEKAMGFIAGYQQGRRGVK